MSEKKKGRPVVYKGNLKRAIVSVVRENGLSKAMTVIQNDGVTYQPAPGKAKVTEKHNITLPTLAKLAKEAGITFKRGRPSVGAGNGKKKSAAIKTLETAAAETVDTVVVDPVLEPEMTGVESETVEVATESVEVAEAEVDFDALASEVQSEEVVETVA